MTRRDDKPRIKGAQSDADEAASRMTRGGVSKIF
jgi:hypothetical protein